MADLATGGRRSKAQILEDIDRKLPKLPIAQQNMVAAYAHGIKAGLALRDREPERDRAHAPEPAAKP